MFGRRVRVEATEVLEGVLTSLDFSQLVLDGHRALPLGIVRGIRAC